MRSRIRLIQPQGFLIPAVVLLVALSAGSATWAAQHTSSIDDARWEESIAAFAAADRQKAPSPGGVVFVGSSSIRLWSDLERQLSEAGSIINRGFGGARLSDCTRYLDRVVFPYAPRLIVVYAGDNDLADGRQPKEVFNDFVRFVETTRKTLPDTKILYVSIKPSPARAALLEQIREANGLIRQFVAKGANLEFVDVFTPMLDDGGRPRGDLFQADALHLNPAGYALWASVIGPRVR